jgi:GNAT superfamily N-acetyltransferase
MRPSSLEYRLMKRGEEAEVSRLAHQVFDEFVAPQFSHEGVREFQIYSDPHLLLLRSRWNHFVLLAAAEEMIAGMIEVRYDGHVALFFVEGQHQGSGVGGELLRRALEICLIRNPKLSKVTVNSSPNAVGIYERLGFRQAGAERAENRMRFVPMVLDLFRPETQLPATGRVKQKVLPSPSSDSTQVRPP